MVNKLNINIENNNIRYLKYNDAFLINSYAQNAYDHTFTENLIVVTHDEQDGLYQARPKTAFDTVVTQKHNAKQNAVERMEKIRKLNNDIALFGAVETDTSEYIRLCQKCDALFAEFEQEYEDLEKRASKVVQQYYNAMNKDFLIAKIEKRNVISKDFLMKLIFVFCMGAVLSFILYSAIEAKKERRKQRKQLQLRKKLMAESKTERGNVTWGL